MNSRKYRLIVVEDEPPILENIIEKVELTDNGFLVVSNATNGLDALKEIEIHKPDVLFTDVRMPVMDGLQLIKEVRNRFPDIHIVILSGYSEFSYAQQALKLNVRDYLLKPLKVEQLAETLAGIREELNQKHHNLERESIIFDVLGNRTDKPFPATLQNSRFLVCLICIGNLQKNASESSAVYKLHDIWEKMNWHEILQILQNPIQKWFFVGGHVPNQKFLVLALDQDISMPKTDIDMFAEKMAYILTASAEPFHLTLCIDDSLVSYHEIGKTAQKLRTVLETGLRPCLSTVLYPASTGDKKPSSVCIDAATENGIRKLMERKDISSLKRQLISLINGWIMDKHPQSSIENALTRLVLILQTQLSASALDTNDIKLRLSDVLADTYDINSLPEALWLVFEDLLSKDNFFNDSTEDIIKKIAEYIKINLADNLSLDQISKKFNFNSSYLIRIFKQYTGETPMQYLITLRIEEAKRLMIKNPFWDLKDISEIVGYTDQHYFSRVFKNVTGLSPSEYKDNLSKLIK